MLRQGACVVGYGVADAMTSGRISPLCLMQAGVRMPRPNLLKEMWASRGFQGLSLLGLERCRNGRATAAWWRELQTADHLRIVRWSGWSST
jgi:hypothetical protein